MPGQDFRTVPPEARQANRQVAAAISHARALARLEQPEFAVALSRAGSPANYNMVSKWETGANRIPGYVLVAAARVAKVTVSELLAAVGVEQQDAGQVSDQFAAMDRRMKMLEARLDAWEIELAASQGLEPRPERAEGVVSLDDVRYRARIEELERKMQELVQQQNA